MNDPISNYVRDRILKVAKELPSCPEAIYQMDKWQEFAPEILERLCTDLGLYESAGTQ